MLGRLCCEMGVHRVENGALRVYMMEVQPDGQRAMVERTITTDYCGRCHATRDESLIVVGGW
jgi:hypothetical protein